MRVFGGGRPHDGDDALVQYRGYDFSLLHRCTVPLWPVNASLSAASGRPSVSPGAATTSAATLLASAMDCSTVRAFSRPPRKPAAKASPAPTESMALTGIAGMCTVPVRPVALAPCAPCFTTTRPGP